MNKFLVGGALGLLLIAGQAIAARLPEAPAARVADPAVATAVTADPAVAPAARRAAPVVVTAELTRSPVVDRLDPVAADPAGVADVGPLTEAETARLAVMQAVSGAAWKSSFELSAKLSPPIEPDPIHEDCSNGIDDDSDGLVDAADEDDCGRQRRQRGSSNDGTAAANAGTAAAIVGIGIVGVVVATNDDSDS